jgi:hypothetical protein
MVIHRLLINSPCETFERFDLWPADKAVLNTYTWRSHREGLGNLQHQKTPPKGKQNWKRIDFICDVRIRLLAGIAIIIINVTNLIKTTEVTMICTNSHKQTKLLDS